MRNKPLLNIVVTLAGKLRVTFYNAVKVVFIKFVPKTFIDKGISAFSALMCFFFIKTITRLR